MSCEEVIIACFFFFFPSQFMWNSFKLSKSFIQNSIALFKSKTDRGRCDSWSPFYHFQESEAQSNKSDENVTMNYLTP